MQYILTFTLLQTCHFNCEIELLFNDSFLLVYIYYIIYLTIFNLHYSQPDINIIHRIEMSL